MASSQDYIIKVSVSLFGHTAGPTELKFGTEKQIYRVGGYRIHFFPIPQPPGLQLGLCSGLRLWSGLGLYSGLRIYSRCTGHLASSLYFHVYGFLHESQLWRESFGGRASDNFWRNSSRNFTWAWMAAAKKALKYSSRVYSATLDLSV